MHEPDASLGWRMKAGRYEIAAYAPGGEPIRMTVLEDGSRYTGGVDPEGRRTLVFVGGSYVQGWAVTDEATMAWRIQRRLPGWRVVNLGTGAYGTYQSLLVMERLFSEPAPPDAVIYGFIGHHEPRNVAAPEWLRTLAHFSRRGSVAVPYCTLDPAGGLLRHPPTQYPTWPLRRQLALVAFLESAYNDKRTNGIGAQSVTSRLLLEMDRLARSHGVHFSVALLSFEYGGDKAHYSKLLERHGIDAADCAFPLTPEMRVPGEGHPNGLMNERWARCIEKKLLVEIASRAPR